MDLDETLRKFLEEEAPTLPSGTVQQRVLRGLSEIGVEIDQLSAAIPRMDLQSEAGRLYLRHRVARITRLLAHLGQVA